MKKTSATAKEKYLIIGGGPAAVYAANQLRQNDAFGEIVILCEENHLPYNRPILSSLIANNKPIKDILMHSAAFYEEKAIRFLQGQKVVSINKDLKTAQTASGEKFYYTKLLLATGSFAFNPLPVTENTLPVHTVRVYEDVQNIIALAQNENNKKVIVVGGGILGIEAAISLLKQGCKVSIVELAPRLLQAQADPEASVYLKLALQKLDISIHTAVSVQELRKGGALLSDGSFLSADFAIASLGVRSNVALAQDIGLEINRGIVVDAAMQTSLPNIWAAGDCAELEGCIPALFGTAIAMGKAAANSMTGAQPNYVSFTPTCILKFDNFDFTSVGQIPKESAETAIYQNIGTGVYRKLLLNNSQLKAVLSIGSAPIAKFLTAVKDKVDIESAVSLLSNN